MNTLALKDLKTYWEVLRAGRIAPYRAELDPRKFENALEFMFILEQLSPRQLRVRLAGMALCSMMGMEVRGMPPEALINAADRQKFLRLLDSALNDPAVVELTMVGIDAAGQRSPAQMLLLPLRSDFGEVSRILGCVVMSEPTGNPPVSFTILEESVSVVMSEVLLSPETSMSGFSEAQAGFIRPEKPRLRAVDGNPHATPEKSVRMRNHLRVVSED